MTSLRAVDVSDVVEDNVGVFPTPVFVEGHESTVVRRGASVVYRTRTDKYPIDDPRVMWKTLWFESVFEALLKEGIWFRSF